MGVREKANYSSQQLMLAAQMADQSIRYIVLTTLYIDMCVGQSLDTEFTERP